MEEYLRATIRKHRRSALAVTAAHWAGRYLNAWHNTGFYDFDQNGERFLLETARKIHNRPLTVWDVGAHEGEYALAVHSVMPSAKVTSFEILPQVAAKLRAKNLDAQWFTLQEIGLSDRPGTVDVTYNHKFHTTNAINPRNEIWLNHDEVEVVKCSVSTVDELVSSGSTAPDILKIDVEGHEAAVLDGAQALLGGDQAPILVQFEYGATWIPSSRTLCQVQTKLEACGYAVGRLYSDHVSFKPYEYSDEHYRMGNMVAVRDHELQKALSAA